MIIYLRSETYENEFRAPLVPDDVRELIQEGFTVIVEKSNKRIFRDIQYLAAGARLTRKKWYDQNTETIIIGIKELDRLDLLKSHIHIYFSHTYKNQKNSKEILRAFAKSKSILYDLEYFCNPDGKRTLAFGFYAGLVGIVLGLRQHYNKSNALSDISDLEPWKNMASMVSFCKFNPDVKIGIVGNGRCSKGVQYILDFFKLNYDLIGRDVIVPEKYDILINCIVLDESYTKVWIGPEFQKDIVVIDVSCDYSKKNNPIPVYKEATTWSRPVFNYNKYISVIAIDNLPSLLPKESSKEFSYELTKLLKNYGNPIWQNTLETFRSVLSERLSYL
jgi:saccharopine dehydrogenase (NAD+, L-lysine-forming)